MARIPQYRRREIRGKAIAVVTLTDSVIKRRKDYWLGKYDCPESHEMYHRLLADWQASGRRLAEDDQVVRREQPGCNISQLCVAYYESGSISDHSFNAVKVVIRLLISMYGSTPVKDFGPNALRLVREAMIAGDPVIGRKPWTRCIVVRYTAMIVRIFRWAVSRELIDESFWRRLQSLEPLDHRRTDIKANRKILPAPIGDVRAVQKIVSRQVAAMIELQLLTGARVEEVLFLRPCDIDQAEEVWHVLLENHKNAHRGKRRVLYFGPKAQLVLRPFLLRAPRSYLFSPAEAEAERRRKLSQRRVTPIKYGNRPGTNKQENPKRQAGDHYDKNSYRRCIQRACKKCGIPLWSPRQLRHNAATEIEKHYDSVTAAILLGHSSAKITEAIYIQREDKKAIEVSARIG